jgi:hypothetical protein
MSVSLLRLDQQEQGGRLRSRIVRARIGDEDLGPDDCPESRIARGLVEARNAVDAADVPQSERRITQLRRAIDEILGVGGRFEEGERAPAAKLHIVGRGTGRGDHIDTFAFFSLLDKKIVRV